MVVLLARSQTHLEVQSRIVVNEMDVESKANGALGLQLSGSRVRLQNKILISFHLFEFCTCHDLGPR